ncbi:protein CUP-SHAPED COTYLEDON 2-like [Punica granatum]|uniref:Protein CUP-SHAPED COTYLEDON 2-like n=1 Tax=Punica granatum TaxID=22663 RepID=A0A6P8C7T2_PUNGR|nr:protein CUP-SHAPED COTYLEDON 2-like [Punica granatum]
MEIPEISGLNFHPTDDELLTYYLKLRILDYFQDPTLSLTSYTIPDIELYSMHPKELPRQFKRLTKVKSNGREWVFFCLRKEQYRNSSRSERTVPTSATEKCPSLFAACITKASIATNQLLLSEEEIWQSLPKIQRLPHNLSNYDNFIGRAEEDVYIDESGSSLGRYYTGGGDGSTNCYYPSNDETNYYPPYHGIWGSHNY